MSERSVRLIRSGDILAEIMSNEEALALVSAQSTYSVDDIKEALTVAINATSNEVARENFDEDEGLDERLFIPITY